MRRIIAALAWFVVAPAVAQAETRWTLVKSYPHDPKAFTEGLLWADGSLYESTGLNGSSDIRQVRLKDGKVVRRTAIEPQYFGEGIVNWGDRIVSLTWRHRQGFVWDRKTFKRTGNFRYEGEGWALTQDGHAIIMSDGTSQLRFLDPQTLQEQKRITVTWNGRPVDRLNELEYVKGEVLANIWYESRIARINPATGAVIDWIDLSPLAAQVRLTDSDAVLNGIAYDAAKDRLFVTGKFWPKLFEIKLQR
ncbi:glutamine cyclotransferase [Sphingobium sp. SCG-1]|uniref:glutaminyl-peptide cyclotransferase n=1 Tax=Sphingobium sp. SCG-1 TaxID=2072936 RepID=UPI000CD687D1|nr:glutaminyl-peptide cyclotransferase [Sphingobium sp. SCG-1]AUW60000.1 glutamine cyclotransferase [Sphingobium sp. SCG-1]